MRVRLIFDLKNRGAYVPFHHQFLIAQVIRGVLVKGGQKQYLDFQDFNFSGLKGQTKISRKGLHFFSQKVTLVISSGSEDFIDYFEKSLFSVGEVMVGNLNLSPDRFEHEPEVSFTEYGKFLCLSPLAVLPATFGEEDQKRFISPESDEFSDLLYELTLSRMESSGKFSPDELSAFYRFQLVPDKEYLKRLDEGHKKFSRIYPMFDSDIRYELRGYTFPFTLFASPKVLEFVYKHGLGHSTHKGFGMLDMANNAVEPVLVTQTSKIVVNGH